MRYIVTHSCIACGLCAETCPEVFALDKESHTARAIPGDAPEECLERAAEARDDCPVGAIEEA